MLDIGGFLTSMEFLTQIASVITAVLAALASEFVSILLSGGV